MKAPIIIIICVVAFITILLSLKITLKITHKESFSVAIKILFFKIRLYPQKEKKRRYPHSMSRWRAKMIKRSLEKKPKKKKPVKSQDEDEAKKKKQKKPLQLKKDDILSIISISISFVKSFVKLFARAIRVKTSRLHVVVASDDAAKTAMLYTAVTQSINLLFPLLDGLKTVKKLPHGKNLSVDVDFLAEEPTIDIDIEIYFRIIGGAIALFGALISALKKAVKKQFRRLERRR